jgi:UDP-N-acetylglucosamine 2-epimerase (non-hydrolysing)
MHGPAHHSRKIMIVFGTRPEAIKMFPVIHALRRQARLDVRVCLTGQHRAMLDQVLEIAGLTPDIDLNIMQPDQTLDQLLARLVTELGRVFDRDRPDRILVHGDTLTTLAATLAAYFRRIPVGHVEAGLRSGNIYQPWPEEVNRRVAGTIADMHFAPTPVAAEALRREQVPPDSIWVTGNSGIDALLYTRAAIRAQPQRAAYLDQILAPFARHRILAMTTHRRENLGAGLGRITAAIASLAAQRPDIAFICPVHPNPQVRQPLQAALSGRENVVLTDPLDYPNFVRLLDRASLVLTDSGGVQEEAPALGKPVLVMRDTTERPEGVAAGNACLVGTDTARIIGTVARLLDDDAAYAAMARAHNPYGDGKAAARIADVIANAD